MDYYDTFFLIRDARVARQILRSDFAHRGHSRFFALSREKFDELNCLMMGTYELMILVVLLGPYLGLRIVGAP